MARSVRQYVRATLVLIACWFAVSCARDPANVHQAQVTWNNTALTARTMMSTLEAQSEKVTWTALEESIQELQKSTKMAWAALLESTPSIWTPEKFSPESCSAINNVKAPSQPTFWHQISRKLSVISSFKDGATTDAGASTCASDACDTGYASIFRQSGHNYDQIGRPIPVPRQQPGGNLGRSISISADGLTVAIGAFQARGAGKGAGHIQVFQFKGARWTQIGADIIGPKDGDRFGFAVALTPDARFFTTRTNAHDGVGFTNNNPVQVYENQSGTWTKVGSDTVRNGDSSQNLGLLKLTISPDGQIMATRGPLGAAADDTNSGETIAKPFTAWTTGNPEKANAPTDATTQIPEPVFMKPITLQGAPEAQFGRTIALSADGSILAVGAPFHNEFGSEAGRVGLYQLVGNSANMLFEFSGDQVGLRVGHSLSMSRTSPPILAIGGTDFVNVYPISQFLNGGGGPDAPVLEFNRFEADFIEEDYGAAISMSEDGTRLAVGAPRASIGSPNVGIVQVYLIGTGQIGPAILGVEENDLFGSTISLSEDGTTVAIGAFTGASGAGYASIFRQSGHSWDQVGQTIEGRQRGDNLGGSISISADGQTVAIGACQADAGAGTSTGTGYVQVYQFDGTAWTQVGADIVGPNDGDCFGFSVALTPDASFLTIGANAHDSGGFANNGLVQAYENQSGTWTKLGGDIVGNADSRNLGVALAISSDGQVIAAGGPLGTVAEEKNVGVAVVYPVAAGRTRNLKATAARAGMPAGVHMDSPTRMHADTEPIFMERIASQGTPDAQFGRSLALSTDGSILAVGAPFHHELDSEAGRVYLYQLVGRSLNVLFEFSGNQVGLRVGQSLSMSRTSPPVLAIGGTDFVDVYPISQFLNGGEGPNSSVVEFNRFEAEFLDDDYGAAVSVSGDGTRLAVGAPRAAIDAPDVGMVQVYLLGTGQIGSDILGLDENDLFGSAVSLSEDGMTVAIGAFTGASGAGYASIFRQSVNHWVQVGQTIQGQQRGDNLGRSISISADGQTVAIGAYQANVEASTGIGAGYVQVYQFEGTSWTQVGADIVGPNDGDHFGFSVALTPDASFLTIGANAHDSGGFANNGLVQAYENQSGTWTKLGGDIVGSADSRNLGVGLATSSDGRIVATGGPLSTAAEGENVGEALVYDL
jgi:hypothetical protein